MAHNLSISSLGSSRSVPRDLQTLQPSLPSLQRFACAIPSAWDPFTFPAFHLTKAYSFHRTQHPSPFLVHRSPPIPARARPLTSVLPNEGATTETHAFRLRLYLSVHK